MEQNNHDNDDDDDDHHHHDVGGDSNRCGPSNGDDELHLESIDSLTSQVFTELLQRHWKSCCHIPKITSLRYQPVDQGVLSHVYLVTLEIEGQQQQQQQQQQESHILLPSQWIVKFCRAELGLEWMFQAEGAFYTHYAPQLLVNHHSQKQQLPFDVPKFLYASSHHLFLEYAPDMMCFDLMTNGGCPPDKVEFCIHALASWHAQSWDRPELFCNNKRLVQPPGMGQRLHPLQKEYLFVTSWQAVLDRITTWKDDDDDNNNKLKDFAKSMCTQLANLQLRHVHNKVHDETWACVHGDYHIANWLFPKNSSSRKKPLLIDWATCGYGNPMIDLVFFLIVSSNDNVVTKDLNAWLERYFQCLRQAANPLKKIPEDFLETKLRDMFQWALICQWMILVAYDELCQNSVASNGDETLRQKQLLHFQNVNVRALLALQHGIGDDGLPRLLAQIPLSTPKERQEAQTFSQGRPLLI